MFHIENCFTYICRERILTKGHRVL